MTDFLNGWQTAARTSIGLFWMAFWAFGFGYMISGAIQVFVTRERMQRTMGESGPRSMALASFFGLVSSSCSFAALSTTRALFTKGAGLGPSLAFLLASTNLVIELGIVISVFLAWQFVVGEYVGGVLMILLMWAVVRATASKQLVESMREHAREQESEHSHSDGEPANWKKLIRTWDGWKRVSKRYLMEWAMVWKDVTIGFTVAGAIAAFVPREFFQALFVGSGSQEPAFWQVLCQSLVGPVAAFFTFIGSMGNIPLAAVLFGNGVSFAGIMAFMFSDLVVMPVLRIQASYYGWKPALYILGVFLTVLVTSSLLLHYGFAAMGALPDASAAKSVTEREFFHVDYTFFLNLLFLLLTGVAVKWKLDESGVDLSLSGSAGERTLAVLAFVGFFWVAGGLAISLVG